MRAPGSKIENRSKPLISKRFLVFLNSPPNEERIMDTFLTYFPPERWEISHTPLLWHREEGPQVKDLFVKPKIYVAFF